QRSVLDRSAELHRLLPDDRGPRWGEPGVRRKRPIPPDPGRWRKQARPHHRSESDSEHPNQQDPLRGDRREPDRDAAVVRPGAEQTAQGRLLDAAGPRPQRLGRPGRARGPPSMTPSDDKPRKSSNVEGYWKSLEVSRDPERESERQRNIADAAARQPAHA